MTDHAELIERLRTDVMYDAYGDPIVPSLLDEAATALDTLVAERDRLRGLADWVSKHYANQDVSHQDFRVEAEFRARAALAQEPRQ